MKQSRSNRAAFLFAEKRTITMTRDELLAIVKRSNADTLIATRLRDALGLPHPRTRGRTRDRSRKSRRYRGARKLMKQRHGVRL